MQQYGLMMMITIIRYIHIYIYREREREREGGRESALQAVWRTADHKRP